MTAHVMIIHYYISLYGVPVLDDDGDGSDDTDDDYEEKNQQRRQW